MKRLRHASWALPLTAAALTLPAILLFLARGAKTPAGIPALPLDDAYIHLQYALQAARGEFLQYNPGDPATSGATSLLYMLLLALGFAAGLSAETMPVVALAGGLLLFPLTAALIAATARHAARPLFPAAGAGLPAGPAPATVAGLLAALLFAGSGWIAWAYASGMETGLLITLVAATFWAFAAGRPRLTALFALLAILTRPEVLVLALLLALLPWLPGTVADERRPYRLWLLLPLLAVPVQPLLNLAATGSATATGTQVKSWFSLEPFYLDQVLLTITRTGVELLAGLFSSTAGGRFYLFPLALPLALLGAWLLWTRSGRGRGRALALLLPGWLLGGVAVTATLQTATWHHHRYQMPLYPALAILLALALTWLSGFRRTAIARRWPSARRLPGGPGIGLVTALVALWAGYSLLTFSTLYARDTWTVTAQQMVLARTLRATTAEDATVAVHDVGVFRYLGQRQTVDVVGLTTAGMAQASHSGPGAIYEALERWQPDYYAVYPQAAPPYFGIEAAPTLLGEELARVDLGDYWSPATSAAATQVLTRPDWSQVELATAPQQPDVRERIAGWARVDALDVADLESEAAHSYRWWHAGRPAGFLTEPRQMGYQADPAVVLADGGRLLTGGEAFTLHTPDPEQHLLLVARLHQTADVTLSVQVNGADAGWWHLPALPGVWLESAFLIPPRFLEGNETRIELTIVDAPPETRYSPFYYWAYQGTPQTSTPEPETSVGATFGEVATLRGYGLPSTTFAPGDVIPLTLYWQALSPPRVQHRVFVHLVDPQNDTAEGIIAQADSPPRSGTYPFWVWQPGESVRDTVQLAIPAGARPGRYLLLLGLYDALTDERVPLQGGENFGSNRLLLEEITLR